MFDCIIFVGIIKELPFAFQSQRNLILKRQSQHNGDTIYTSRCFSQGTRFTDDYSILALEARGFFQELLQT